MQSHAVKGIRLVEIEWWYDVPAAQGAPAKHSDRVRDTELSEFCRQLRAVADATDRFIHINIGE